jgi:hypothetical protein
MGEACLGARLRSSPARVGVEETGGVPQQPSRSYDTDGEPWAKRWGKPFANRASTRPRFHISVGSSLVIASTVPEKRAEITMRINWNIGKRLRFFLCVEK